MKMTDHQRVDGFQAGALGCVEDSLGIPASLGPPGVDEHRFSRRRDDQRRGSTLDVDPIDFQIAVLRAAKGAATRKASDKNRDTGDSLVMIRGRALLYGRIRPRTPVATDR